MTERDGQKEKEMDDIPRLLAAAPGYVWTKNQERGARSYLGDGWLEAHIDCDGWPLFTGSHPRFGKFTYHMCPFGHIWVDDLSGRAELQKLPHFKKRSELISYFKRVEILSFDTFWTNSRRDEQSRLLDEINLLRASWGLERTYTNYA